MIDISKHLEELLLELGTSPDQVAKTLKARGIRGFRNTTRILNPIVLYVRRAVKVDCRDMDLIKPGSLRITFPDGSTIEAAVPQAVREFLNAFSEGKFPEVEERRIKAREAKWA